MARHRPWPVPRERQVLALGPPVKWWTFVGVKIRLSVSMAAAATVRFGLPPIRPTSSLASARVADRGAGPFCLNSTHAFSPRPASACTEAGARGRGIWGGQDNTWRAHRRNTEAPLWTVLTDREHIVRWAFRSRRNYTAAVPRLIHEYPDLIVVRLRSQHEADGWLSGPLAVAVGAVPPDEQRKPLPCPDDC